MKAVRNPFSRPSAGNQLGLVAGIVLFQLGLLALLILAAMWLGGVDPVSENQVGEFSS